MKKREEISKEAEGGWGGGEGAFLEPPPPPPWKMLKVETKICVLAGNLTSQQYASLVVYLRDGSAQTIVHVASETEVANQTFYLTQPKYTDTRQASPSTDPVMPVA